MDDKIKLLYNGNKYEFPIIKGSEDELAIDIKTLRQNTGLITLDPGYKNTGSCISDITYLDGENGVLRYRGYDIADLANNSSFIEVSYLLIFGELPSKSKCEEFENDIKEELLVHEDIKTILKSFPTGAHPMGILASLTSALISFNPGSVDVRSEEKMYRAIVQLMAKFSILTAWVHRKHQGLPLNYPDISISYVENLSKMMFMKPNKNYTNHDAITSALNNF